MHFIASLVLCLGVASAAVPGSFAVRAEAPATTESSYTTAAFNSVFIETSMAVVISTSVITSTSILVETSTSTSVVFLTSLDTSYITATRTIDIVQDFITVPSSIPAPPLAIQVFCGYTFHISGVTIQLLGSTIAASWGGCLEYGEDLIGEGQG